MSQYFLIVKLIYGNEDDTNEKDVDLDLREFDSFNEFLTTISKLIDTKITLTKYEIKINYESAWVNLIDLKALYFFISNDLILNNQTKLMIKRREEIQGIARDVHFNKKGEKFENNEECESNRPNMKIYDFNNPEVYCAFCTESSKDEYKLRKLGPIYGPVKKANKNFYFHELCALWSPNVFMDENGKLKNINSEIKRSKKIKCSFCGAQGAGIGCFFVDNCNNNYHFLCAKSVGSALNDQRYIIFCPYHKKDSYKHSNEIYESKPKSKANSICYSDMVCNECKSGLDEDKIILCDQCDFAIHTYCHSPEIINIPDHFFCSYCAINKL